MQSLKFRSEKIWGNAILPTERNFHIFILHATIFVIDPEICLKLTRYRSLFVQFLCQLINVLTSLDMLFSHKAIISEGNQEQFKKSCEATNFLKIKNGDLSFKVRKDC